ncbi:Pto kinase interactor 1 [Dorcoceras hygrometricum]|uniref:Pto kinase interactor 1 n=1 Tax=Dorcoceras hygrometricum TaxID=472368 RepID=A0A2Z7BNY9_9LAMI|nr:Pto kinase interactor 1 [Dorcoceras hygrometricum]
MLHYRGFQQNVSCCEEDDMHRATDNGLYMKTYSADIRFQDYEINQRVFAGHPAGYRAIEVETKDIQTINMLPISSPTVSVDELKDIIDNFGTKSLILRIIWKGVPWHVEM